MAVAGQTAILDTASTVVETDAKTLGGQVAEFMGPEAAAAFQQTMEGPGKEAGRGQTVIPGNSAMVTMMSEQALLEKLTQHRGADVAAECAAKLDGRSNDNNKAQDLSAAKDVKQASLAPSAISASVARDTGPQLG